MPKPTRPSRRNVSSGRRASGRPPTVVSQGVVNKTEAARRSAEPSGPRVLLGAAAERERQLARLPVSDSDRRRWQLELAWRLPAAILALVFAGWTIFSAVAQQTAAIEQGAAVDNTAMVVAALIAGLFGFFGMYLLTRAVTIWRQGPRGRPARRR